MFFVECCVTDLELQTLRDKTNRQLRLRELLLENSSQSTLVVMYVIIHDNSSLIMILSKKYNN